MNDERENIIKEEEKKEDKDLLFSEEVLEDDLEIKKDIEDLPI